MSTSAVENLIISSIHAAAPDQSAHIAKAILLDLAANGHAL